VSVAVKRFLCIMKHGFRCPRPSLARRVGALLLCYISNNPWHHYSSIFCFVIVKLDSIDIEVTVLIQKQDQVPERVMNRIHQDEELEMRGREIIVYRVNQIRVLFLRQLKERPDMLLDAGVESLPRVDFQLRHEPIKVARMRPEGCTVVKNLREFLKKREDDKAEAEVKKEGTDEALKEELTTTT
jgi:hypothetical protein